MLSTRRSKLKNAISRGAGIAIVVIIVIIIVAGAYAALTLGKSSTTTSTTSTTTTQTTTSSSTPPTTTTGTTSTTGTSTTGTTSTSQTTTSTSTSSTSGNIPNVFTYETFSTIQYLDPQVSYYSYDYTIMQNVYEPLLWYNGTSGTQVIPWLAQNYTLSQDGRTLTINLRHGIDFADGEQLNSTAVYFALNKLLIEDSSSPVGHGSQASWILQQLTNTSLSSVLGAPHAYTQQWGKEVIAQNFVQITGPYQVQLNIQNPNAALPYLLAGEWAVMVAPNYVMQKDLQLWSASSSGYNLPYPSPSGNATDAINQYLLDEVATCDTGVTPKGCGTTYLDGSAQGSMAGTGPYVISSFSSTTNNFVLKANPSYWGGPYQFNGGPKIVAHIPTININFVPTQTTRTLDLQNAAKSGQAMAVDVTGDHFFDVAARSPWLTNGTLQSTIPGVTLYGTYPTYSTLFDPYETNVTNPNTGTFYKFQPFADVRLRLAFADAVNMTEINNDVNNRLGVVAINVVPPGLPPAGSYNTSITPRYSYNLTAVQNLLVEAMQQPLSQFTYANGTAAQAGVFDNTFGCKTLNAKGQCDTSTPQTINLVYGTGDTVDQAVFEDIASVVNNISSTYNMGLTVSVVPVPTGQMITEAFSGNLYMYALGWFADYPWVIDFLGPMYAPGQAYTAPDNWNLTQMATLFSQAQNASSHNDIKGLIEASNAMNMLANQEVMYLWTLNSVDYMAMTSNVQGFKFNPSLSTAAGGVAGPELFTDLY